MVKNPVKITAKPVPVVNTVGIDSCIALVIGKPQIVTPLRPTELQITGLKKRLEKMTPDERFNEMRRWATDVPKGPIDPIMKGSFAWRNYVNLMDHIGLQFMITYYVGRQACAESAQERRRYAEAFLRDTMNRIGIWPTECGVHKASDVELVEMRLQMFEDKVEKELEPLLENSSRACYKPATQFISEVISIGDEMAIPWSRIAPRDKYTKNLAVKIVDAIKNCTSCI